MSGRLCTLLGVIVSATLILAGCAEVKKPAPRNNPPLARIQAQHVENNEAAASPVMDASLEWKAPDTNRKLPFKDEQPIYFVNRSANRAEWEKLPQFWNVGTEKVPDPQSGKDVERKIVKIKVPLGLTQNPQVPPENPMTVQKWELGKRLFFDNVLSTTNKVSCANCHDPAKSFADQAPVSKGVGMGAFNSPTAINSAYNTLHFWDGRAASLEDQVQGHVQNPVELFDSRGSANVAEAWPKAIERIRSNAYYSQMFPKVFGTEPTRDAVAKAIACYERTVLAANSIHDRADLARLDRAQEEGKPANAPFIAKDYEVALKRAIDAAKKDKKDIEALRAVGIVDVDKDAAKGPELAKSIANGRELFFGKARCNSCHAGDNFTDNSFHNLGEDFKMTGGQIDDNSLGRFARLPLGHKNPELIGAWKTPTCRSLATTFPYMHTGNEKTLEDVVKFYNKGGNPNEFLDGKMRDVDAEREYFVLGPTEFKKKYTDKEVFVLGDKIIIPLKLHLTDVEQKDLVSFLNALQGDPVDPIVAEPSKSGGGVAINVK